MTELRNANPSLGSISSGAVDSRQQPPATCILYARVSTEEQAVLSIPAQIQAMRDFARQRGWTVIEEFLEPGVSAKTTARPALQRLLARIRKDEAPVHVLLVHKIDRLARNVYDHATIRALLQQRGIRLASVIENVDDTVPGQLVENIMASIAQFYSANLGEEVKKGMRQKVRAGGWPHMPPLGYSLIRHAGAKSTIEIDHAVGPLVRLVFELYATGRWGVRALADHLYKEGLRSRYGKKLAQSNIRKILENPFFAGRLRWEGKESPGNHDPLIPTELFDQVQRTIRKRREDPRAPLSPTTFPLKVVAVCASCRGSMTAEMHGAWSYYRCCRRMNNKEACPSRLSNAKVVHSAFQRICRKLTLSEALRREIESATVTLLAKRSEKARHAVPLLRRQLDEMSKRHHALTRSFTAGQITADIFQGLAESLQGEIQSLERRMTAHRETTDLLLTRVRGMLREATEVWSLYGTLSPERQIELLRAVFESVVLGPAGIVGHVLREPFASLFDAGAAECGLGPGLESTINVTALSETCLVAAEAEAQAKAVTHGHAIPGSAAHSVSTRAAPLALTA